MTLNGKVALVTGGSGDIGSAIARTLALQHPLQSSLQKESAKLNSLAA